MNVKYAYWLNHTELQYVQNRLQALGHKTTLTDKVVCSPLSDKIETGIVPPKTWSETKVCRRQLSWYQISRHAGQYLLISSRDLTECGLQLQIVLEPRPESRPPSLPQHQDLFALLQKDDYLAYKPEKWDDLDAEDPAEQKRWMKIMGIRRMEYEQLFVYHCANHANFLDPVYFLREDEHIVPYSIAPTKYICSACLELFNIIGESFHKKLVMPCPGAVIFAGLSANKYIAVTTWY